MSRQVGRPSAAPVRRPSRPANALLSRNEPMKVALEGALREVGIATIFTAITLSVGVATWAFSDLKFQADMGILLTFMFMINMVMAITVLPAFAVKLDSLFPRKGPVKAPAIGH